MIRACASVSQLDGRCWLDDRDTPAARRIGSRWKHAKEHAACERPTVLVVPVGVDPMPGQPRDRAEQKRDDGDDRRHPRRQPGEARQDQEDARDPQDSGAQQPREDEADQDYRQKTCERGHAGRLLMSSIPPVRVAQRMNALSWAGDPRAPDPLSREPAPSRAADARWSAAPRLPVIRPCRVLATNPRAVAKTPEK
jgi:hypothetical protein